MATTPSKVKIRIASTITDYLFIRRLRNSVAHLLTGNSNKISFKQQLWFFLFRPKNVQLFIAELEEEKIGYLLLRLEKTTTFITEVICEDFRGRGIGAQMIEFAKSQFDHLTAHIIHSNIPSINLHISNGFKSVYENEKFICLEFWRK